MKPPRSLSLALFLIVVLLGASESGASQAPNIVLIIADDLGYGDISAYGAAKIQTPNIDRLAREGIRLTDAHSPNAICVPTRYAILSGTYFMRSQRQWDPRLLFHEGQLTLPGLLKQRGYRTLALGKWHLGFGGDLEPDYNGELKPGPLEIGFDYYFGIPNAHNEPPWVFVENHRVVGLNPHDPIRIIPHDELVKQGRKDLDLGWGISEGSVQAHAARPVDKIDIILANKAKELIAQNSDAPFFLYLAFSAPHVPIAPSPEFQGTSQAGPYGDYIQQLDASLGIVLDALESLTDKSLIVFTSDNGAVLHPDVLNAGHRSNGPFLGQKTDAWEGGHRVPFIARWPGRIPAGTQGSQLFGLTDLMATVAAAADIAIPDGAAPDSLNQLGVLIDPIHARAVRTEFLMEGIECYALRQGDYAYLPKQGSCGFTTSVWQGLYPKLGFINSDIDAAGGIKPSAPASQLYNLATDPGQTTNLVANEPRRAALMQKRLQELITSHAP